MADTGLTQLGRGTVLGGAYRVESALSSGGMGAVYVATQLQTRRKRAIKVMHPELARDERFRTRFRQEAQVGAQIESEHVVQVIDAGVDDATGMPWLAMELLEGEDLATRMAARGSLSPMEVRAIFVQLCHAVGAAHAGGVIHRDLKPENLFMARTRRADAAWTLKILDFGIAKVVAEARTKNASTASIGTPLWMAPEQTVPGEVVGPGTDIWSLGLIAYFLLTGRYFWRSANTDASTPMMTLREMAMEALPPASQRASEYRVAHRLPPGFDAWFARCVVREREQRFASVAELLADLDRVLSSSGAPSRAVAPHRAHMAKTVEGAPLGARPRDRTVTPSVQSVPIAPPRGFADIPSRGQTRRYLMIAIGSASLAVIAYLGLGSLFERDTKKKSPRADAPNPTSSAVDEAQALLDEARALAAKGDVDKAHALIQQISRRSPLIQSSELVAVEDQWAEAIFERVDRATDPADKRRLLKLVSAATVSPETRMEMLRRERELQPAASASSSAPAPSPPPRPARPQAPAAPRPPAPPRGGDAIDRGAPI